MLTAPDNVPNKTFGRILNFVFILILNLSIVFAPFSVLYLAVRGGQKKWFLLFFILGSAYYILLYNIGSSESDTLLIITILLWLFMMTLSFALIPKLNRILYKRPWQVSCPAESTQSVLLEIEKIETNSLNTGVMFIMDLEKMKENVEDDTLQENIEQLIELSKIVLSRNDNQTERFFLRYSEKLISMLNKYNEIENTRLNSPEILRTMQCIRDSVGQILIAFRNEISYLYKLDLIDINADIMVFVQTLRAKGLLDENTMHKEVD